MEKSRPLEQLELFPKEEIEAYRVPLNSPGMGSGYFIVDVPIAYTKKLLQFYMPNGEIRTYRLQYISEVVRPA